MSKRLKLKGAGDVDVEDFDRMEIEPILDESITEPVSMTNMFASYVADKKLTSKLIKELSEHFPLGDLSHLRRVKKTSEGELMVLLCPTQGHADHASLDEVLGDKPVSKAGLGAIETVKVASVEVKTRRQFEECSQHWPLSFHEDKRLELLLRGDFFSKENQLKIENYAKKALQAAEEAQKKGEEAVGAVIVDPTSDEVMAVSHPMCSQHPLNHAVMVAVDLIGKSQGGGAYSFQDSYLYSRQNLSDADDKTGPYLCTGYDLYVTREPCIMCAMALVHSRINRVFYISPQKNGALGSRYKLHIHKGLNHHYEVFRIKGLKENFKYS